MDDIIRMLEWAFDFKQACRVQGDPESLHLVGREDGIGHTGFIFQGQEDEPARRAGPLSYDDMACQADRLAIGNLLEVGGSLESSFLQYGS